MSHVEITPTFQHPYSGPEYAVDVVDDSGTKTRIYSPHYYWSGSLPRVKKYAEQQAPGLSIKIFDRRKAWEQQFPVYAEMCRRAADKLKHGKKKQ